MRRAVVVLGMLLALGVPLGLTLHKESVLASGRPVLLELAPVDPRSLMQGDYMRLRYKASDEAERHGEALPADGFLVVRTDERGVATFVRVHEGAPLAAGECLVRYRRRDRGVRLGAESYFFQEGQSELFAKARYGELRAAPGGETVLVGLRDAELSPLGPPRRPW